MALRLLVVTIFTALQVAPTYAEPHSVTVRDLIENHSSYQGKLVRVEGVLNFNHFETRCLRHGKLILSLNLYRPIDDEDLEKNSPKVEKQLDEDDARLRKWRLRGLHGRWVEVVGVFDRSKTGHFGMIRSGGIRDIQSIKLKEHGSAF